MTEAFGLDCPFLFQRIHACFHSCLMMMKSICSAMMLCCLSSCYMFDADLPCPKGEYGERSKKNITITATTGFRKPGIYHVPRGTTLREFLSVAKVRPSRDWEAENGWMSGCVVRQLHEGKAKGFLSEQKPSEKQLDAPLEDGAEVAIMKWNW